MDQAACARWVAAVISSHDSSSLLYITFKVNIKNPVTALLTFIILRIIQIFDPVSSGPTPVSSELLGSYSRN